MGSLDHISLGQFGDHRDDPPRHPGYTTHLYQPPGSKNRFQLDQSNGSVTARRLGKPDEILPGGRAAKQVAGALHTWSGGFPQTYGDDHREIMNVGVRKGFQGSGLAAAMLKVSQDYHQSQGHTLSHSASLSHGDDGLAAGPGRDGVTFARRYPLPGDKPHTHRSQFRKLGVPEHVSQAARTMLGGGRQ